MDWLKRACSSMPLFWWGILSILCVGLIWFLYFPIAHVLQKAFFPVDGFSLGFFAILFRHKVMILSMWNSLLIGVAVTACCLIVSAPLAWIATRYKITGQGLLNGWIMIPMILPPFVGAIGMKQFLARFGSFNLLLMNLGVTSHPIDWLGSGFWGVVILEVLHLFPIVYLNLSAAIANIDPSLEEAAWNLGCKPFRFFRRIVFPLTSPGLFAGCTIVFIWSVTDLGTPLILEYRQVVAYQIYAMVGDMHENPMGYALVVFALVWIGLIYFASKRFFLSRQTHMTAKAVRMGERPVPTGRFQWLAVGLFVLVGTVAVIPHVMVVLTALAEKWVMTIVPEGLTIGHFHNSLVHPVSVMGVRNSILLSSVSTLLDIGLGLTAAFLIARFRFFGRSLLDFSVMLPLALPGLVLAFGYVGAFAGTILDPRANPFPLLIAAYAVRRLPFMVRSVDAGLRQVDPAMEEAALNVGASHAKTLWRISLPMVSSNVIAGSILVFAFAMLEVSDSLILAMKENYYPITKAIYALVNRITDGVPVASALGVFAMILLGGSMIVAGKILGRKMGELFRM